jgi:cell division protein FtsQ
VSKKIRHILRLTALALFAVLIATGSVFAIVKTHDNQKTVKIKDVKITMSRSGKILYLQEKDIKAYLYTQNKLSLLKEQANTIDINYIENTLRRNPYVKHAEVYVSSDGIMYIDVEQRNPILKV